MDSRRQLMYTDAGQMRRKQLVEDLERRLDHAIMERKFVPGIDVVEITGSDVDELARSMELVFRDRYLQRFRSRRAFVNIYLALGALMVMTGLFYDSLSALIQQPKQLLLIAVGAAMIVAAFVLRFYLDIRSRAFERERDYMRVMEEKDLGPRSPDA